MKTQFIAKTFAWFALVAVILCSCHEEQTDFYVRANGSSTYTTTQLTIDFPDEDYNVIIKGLTESNIKLSGIPGITKGTIIEKGSTYSLSYGGSVYEYILPISGFTRSGNLNVSINKSGYFIPSSHTVTIYYYYTPEVTFESVQADGTTSSTTTELKLTFSQEISGLTASDITLSDVTGVTKGTLSGSGKIYYLGISGFTKGGTLSVAVAKSGYTIKGSPQTVTIYYAP